MTLPLSSQDALSKQVARLKQSLTWIVIIAAPFSLLELIISATFGMINLALAGVLTLIFAGLAFYLRAIVNRVALSRAVSLLCAGILGIIVVAAAVMPFVWPAMLVAAFLATSLGLTYLDDRPLRRLLVATTLVGTLITLLGWAAPFQGLFVLPPPLLIELLTVVPTIVALPVVMLLLWQFRSRLGETLAETQIANAALREVQASLETQVIERTAALQAAMADVQSRADAQARMLFELEEQRTTIRELSVPVIPINASTLVMPLIGALDTARLHQLRDRALQALTGARARYLVLDITGVVVVDSQVAHGMLQVVQAARLLGSDVLLVGIRPEVAQAIVTLGVELQGMRTFADLQAALDYIALYDRRAYMASGTQWA